MVASYKAKVRDPVTHICCCGGGTCVILCSTRGGTAQLIGYPEYGAASVPPRLYLDRVFSGFVRFDGGINSCDCAYSYWLVNYSGTNTYNSVTGVFTQGGVAASEFNGSSCSTVSPVNNPIGKIADFSYGNADTRLCEGSETKTVKNYFGGSGDCSAGTGACHACHTAGFDTLYCTTTGTPSESLTNEDTEANAIARIPGINTWSSYVSCGSDPVCCRTVWQLRGFGQTAFEYIESQIKVQGLGPVTTHVSVKVDILRKPYGTGVPYTLYQTFEDDVTTGTDGKFLIDFGTLPNDVGWDTIASNCRVEVIV